MSRKPAFSIVRDARVEIEKLVPGGQGIATLEDGKKGFFWNALPGEVVTEYEVLKSKASYLEATALRVENLSPHRAEPRDDIHLATSPWQIMDYDFELLQKGELLRESFRQRGLECDAEPVRTDGREYFYRNKMEYSLYWDMGLAKILLAVRRRGTHRKITIGTSSLERAEIFAEAERIVGDLNASGEEARKYQSILLRCDQAGKVAGGLYENHQPHPVFPLLSDTILGREYSYSPNGFFQVNLPVYEMALRKIAKHVETERVLDLYAGVGTIGLSVALDRELTLVEVDGAAYAELERNAGGAAKTIWAKSEEALEFVSPDETVIVDPPRAGCGGKLLERFLEVLPRRIIYLSCNVATQARDLEFLTAKYHVDKIVPFNFFPRTPHLENLVILSVK